MRRLHSYFARASAAASAAVTLALGSVLVLPSGSAGALGPRITYSYVVRGFGNTSSLEAFAAGAAATYADGRGWNLGGSISFRRVATGGDFTLWLAAAPNVASFGSPCDSSYSCTTGRNVIINETRWLQGSPAWNASGASLADYRHMVVNHETGHWLGFAHEYCAGPGQPAPVMQQQSISLQGCRPNPWPTPAERQRLADSRQVPIVTGNPIGNLDGAASGFDSISLRGWALDPDTTATVRLSVHLDYTAISVLADAFRPDVGRGYPGYGNNHGFALTRSVPPGVHHVCVYAFNAAGPGGTSTLGCAAVTVSGSPIGHLDSARVTAGGVVAAGWALDPDSTGAVAVAVYLRPGGQVGLRASQPRPDVAAQYPRWGVDHGFGVRMRAAPGTHTVCAYALNLAGTGTTSALGCLTVQVPG
jgi:hypothetical protein